MISIVDSQSLPFKRGSVRRGSKKLRVFINYRAVFITCHSIHYLLSKVYKSYVISGEITLYYR